MNNRQLVFMNMPMFRIIKRGHSAYLRNQYFNHFDLRSKNIDFVISIRTEAFKCSVKYVTFQIWSNLLNELNLLPLGGFSKRVKLKIILEDRNGGEMVGYKFVCKA